MERPPLQRHLYLHLWDVPADLAEIRRIVKGLRQSHYLDGPTDFDWIFRDSIEEQRERTLYVD